MRYAPGSLPDATRLRTGSEPVRSPQRSVPNGRAMAWWAPGLTIQQGLLAPGTQLFTPREALIAIGLEGRIPAADRLAVNQPTVRAAALVTESRLGVGEGASVNPKSPL